MDKLIDIKYEDVVSLQEQMETFKSQEVHENQKQTLFLQSRIY